MRDVKIVAYATLSSEDESNIANYLNDYTDEVRFLHVDTALEKVKAENAVLRATIAEMEAVDD